MKQTKRLEQVSNLLKTMKVNEVKITIPFRFTKKGELSNEIHQTRMQLEQIPGVKTRIEYQELVVIIK